MENYIKPKIKRKLHLTKHKQIILFKKKSKEIYENKTLNYICDYQ